MITQEESESPNMGEAASSSAAPPGEGGMHSRHAEATAPPLPAPGWARDAGQLGRGGSTHVFELVPTPAAVFATQVACGRYHTAAVTAEGGVLTFGLNDRGQLGRESHDAHVRQVLVVHLAQQRGACCSAGAQRPPNPA